MFKKSILAATAAVVAVTAIPSAASAGHRDGYYNSRYEQSYRGDRYRRGDVYRGARYDRRDYRGQRCSGTTGTIVGGVAGALIGREVASRRGSRTPETIIGAAIGALAGRAVDKSGCRR
jgi:uncharacterized protein YcfJ